MSELKACPFCKGSFLIEGAVVTETTASPARAVCETCGFELIGRHFLGRQMTKEDCLNAERASYKELVKVINNRPIESALQIRIVKLEDEAEKYRGQPRAVDRIAELEQKLAAAMERGKKLETALREIADSPSGQEGDDDYMKSIAKKAISATQPDAPKCDAGDGAGKGCGEVGR